MGFKVPRRTAVIAFEEGHDYYGAEIVLNLDLPIRAFFDLQRMRQDGKEQDAIQFFATDVLESWNLEAEDGGALSADFAGVETLPPAFISALIDRWVTEGTTAPIPLGQRSSDTAGSEEQSTKAGAVS